MIVTQSSNGMVNFLPCKGKKHPKQPLTVREQILLVACCILFMSWLGTLWCAYRWYQVSEGTMKLLSIVTTYEKAD